MSLKHAAKHELEALAVASVYFGCWIASLFVLKSLLLAEYHIKFRRWSIALIGVLVLAKVVLVLEHVSLGGWLKARPAWVDAVARTVLYSAGVIVVLLIERGISDGHQHGGFFAAIEAAVEGVNVPHLWVNVICVSGALLGYNVLSVVRRQLGDRALLNLFLSPLPERHPPY